MPRTASAAVLAAIASHTLGLAIFAELAFADNTLYLYNGIGNFTPAGPPANPASTFPYGQTFTGLGWLAKLSAIPQTTKIQAQNITLSLSGIPSSLVAEATAQVRIVGTATIWLAFFSGGSLITDPVQCFAGRFDVPSLTDSGDTSTISITCENPLLSLNLAPNRLFDDADQQLYFPGDLGMSFVDALANLNLFWPAPNAQGSIYEIYLTVTPASADLGVGATLQLTQNVYFSNSTHISGNAGIPTGLVHAASSDPSIATIDGNGLVTGVSPGICNIIVRLTNIASSGAQAPFSQFRAACTVIVHS
jgi:hypothetical protein